MKRTPAQCAFPFRANLHVNTRADYRRVGRYQFQAKVTAGALARADRALRWHAQRAAKA